MYKQNLKYGKNSLILQIENDTAVQVLSGAKFPGLADVAAETRKVLDYPINSSPLREKVVPGDKVAILVSDITRAWIKYSDFLPTVVDYLNAAGIPDQDILIVIALGAHRKQTENELEVILTKDLVNRLQVIQHDAMDDNQLKFMGVTPSGTEVYLNKAVVEADKVILTGGVVYHFMAGYGGGRKSVMPGISGYKSIQQNHLRLLYPEGGPSCLRLDECASGKTDCNPMNRDQMEIAEFLAPDFLINVVMNAEGQHAGVFAGHHVEAWQEACRMVDMIYGVPIKEKADLVIATCGGFPKDLNLYQAAKTMDNAAAAVKPGGVVILLAECPDIKEPPDFAQWFELSNREEMERELRKNFTIPGYVALWEVVTANQGTFIVVTLPENAEVIKKVGMIPVTSLDEALEIAYEKCKPNPKIIVMTHGANTLPVLKPE